MLRLRRSLTGSSCLLLGLTLLASVSCHRNLPTRAQNYGELPPVSLPTAACSVDRAVVYPGESVSVHVTAADPANSPLTYSFTATDGTLIGNGSEVRWGSSGLSVGTYTISARADNGIGGTATCSANVTIQQTPHRPPTVACTVGRDQIRPGERVGIAVSGIDPESGPLLFGYSASGGTVTGTGSTAVFDSTGLSPGRYELRCSVTDGSGRTTEAATSISIQAPAPPPQPVNMAECLLPQLAKTSVGVDRICMAILDDVVIRLKREKGLTAAIIGCAPSDGPNPQHVALARARNAGLYLIQHGVPRDRVRVGTGCNQAKTAFGVMVIPEGAIYTGTNLQSLPKPNEPAEHKRAATDATDVGNPSGAPSQTNVFQGNVGYKPESPMTVGQTYRVIVKISPNLAPAQLASEVRQAVTEASPASEGKKISEATVVTKSIQMTSKMRAHLSGSAEEFVIGTVTPEDQDTRVQDVTTWEWKVTPLKPGKDRELDLALSGLDSQGIAHTFVPIYTQHIFVLDAPFGDRTKRFIQNNWQWLWTTLLVPIAVWLWSKRKPQRENNGQINIPPDLGI